MSLEMLLLFLFGLYCLWNLTNNVKKVANNETAQGLFGIVLRKWLK